MRQTRTACHFTAKCRSKFCPCHTSSPRMGSKSSRISKKYIGRSTQKKFRSLEPRFLAPPLSEADLFPPPPLPLSFGQNCLSQVNTTTLYLFQAGKKKKQKKEAVSVSFLSLSKGVGRRLMAILNGKSKSAVPRARTKAVAVALLRQE